MPPRTPLDIPDRAQKHSLSASTLKCRDSKFRFQKKTDGYLWLKTIAMNCVQQGENWNFDSEGKSGEMTANVRGPSTSRGITEEVG